ncbi:hypothetical protein Pint_31487 [Pistacia integerrima]|uniref:Uncharacterized protein n=2 Tax=Pistacia TaxID=55512 RepID=A0ACC1ABL9_9ROSI|nr:hypothetical protein Pint_31487 [Pistacia integerrima]KAJ0084934.1 hypothetical protein Patl1_30076 [Pistacia atlantica]
MATPRPLLSTNTSPSPLASSHRLLS